MSEISGLLAGIGQYPVANSQLIAVEQAGSSVFALFGAMGDRIQSGTAMGSQFLQDLAVYITDEETLLATLESLAASGSGASAWASPEIALLEQSISANINVEYGAGGTMSGATQSAALSGIPGVGPAPGSSAAAAPTTPEGIASAAAASAIATPSAFAATLSAPNSSAGSDITQSGGANDAFGSDIGQAGIGNFGQGFHIKEAGFGNTGTGNWLDAMGAMNSQFGSNLLAIGSFNVETGSFDVVNGNSNTISGSFDTANGNNDTIIGNSAQIFGSGLTASTGQTVFGTASNYTVINADGTWSTVVNSVQASSGTGATQNSSLMAAENSAYATAFVSAESNAAQLSSQYSELGWGSVTNAIGSDMAAGSFNMNYGFSSATAISSGLSLDDTVDVYALAAHPWNATNSAADIATLSRIVARDGTSTVVGADAAAALQLISAGIDPSGTITFLNTDATNPNVTSSTNTLSGVSAIDRANGEAYAQSWGAPVSVLNSTLSTLATSSNPVVAQVASAELFLLNRPNAVLFSTLLTAIYDVTQGSSMEPSTKAYMEGEMSSATGSTATWTGSGFAYTAK